ncbi:MAG TPA: ABC transporter permease [Arenibacter sp.]|nr:ABC transporter permease [Arenibacter sp.]
MFDLERWQEVFDAIRKNKLRTFLTGVSVASGIFILVILLGFGQGMQNGIAKEFEGDASNRIGVWTHVATEGYKGLNPGRTIRLRNDNYDFILSRFADRLEHKSPQFRVRSVTINYKNELGNYSVQGVSPEFQQIESQFISKGRYINYKDGETIAKVIVISNKIWRELLKGVEDPIGEYLEVGGINFQIIGVYGDNGGEREENRMFIPSSTAQRVFNGNDKLDMMFFTLKPSKTFEGSLAQSVQFTEDIKNYLQESHMVSPTDPSAISTFNTLENLKRFQNLTGGIKLFFWFVGICTIVAGVVGVGNIMLIIVKERTKEIGIRKALGARPWSIIGMILHESIFVTSVAGFSGLIFSMALLEVFGPHIQVDFILNPSINFTVAISTVLLLIFAGILAGFFPAWRAASIKPIDALRDE